MITSFQDFLLSLQNSSLANKTLDMDQGRERADLEKNKSIAQIAFIIIAFIGVFENGISILAMKKSKELRNPTTTFIINLCLADFVYSVSNLITYLRLEVNHNYYVCIWNTMTKYFVGIESVNLIIAITINRFICVVYPSIYRTVYRLKSLIFQIALTWLYAGIVASFPLFQVWGRYGYDVNVGLCTILKVNGRSASNFFFITAFLLPTIAFSICYPMIFWVTHKAYKRARMYGLSATTATSEDENAREQNSSHRIDEKERKILRVMLVIIVAFIVCYFPVAFIKIFEKDAEMPGFLVVGYFLVNVSNIINPIIYIAMSAEYRKAYLELFQCEKIWAALSTSSNAELIRS